MRNLFNKIKQNRWQLLILLILGLTPLLWYRGNSILVGHDNVFPLNPQVFLQGRLSTWSDLDLGISQSLIMGTSLMHFIDAFPSFFGLPLQLDQQLVWIFWFLGMLIAPYIFAMELSKGNRKFSLIASVFYAFNFFILQGWFIGERTKFSAYIALPLVLTVFLKVYRGNLSCLKAAAINSLILFLFSAGGLYGAPLFGGFFISLICFIIFFSMLSAIEKNFSAIKKLILLSILTLVGFVLVNSYFIFPAAQKVLVQYKNGVAGNGGVVGLINWASEISANTDYSNLLRLQGIPDWYDNPSHPYSSYFLNNPFLVLISFLWPLIIVCSLVFIKDREKQKFIYYLFFVFLIGILFSAGTHPPLGFFYIFLFEKIPGFAIFRTPYYKFAPAIFFSASMLSAYAIEELSEKSTKLVIPFFVILILVYHFPYFTGNFFTFRPGFATRNQIPPYVFDFGKWAQNKKDAGRILLLPEINNDWQYDIYNWGFLSLQVLPTLTTNKDILSNDDMLNGSEKSPVLALYKAIESGNVEYAKNLAGLLNVRYLLLRNDVAYNLDWIPTAPPSLYASSITKSFHLKPYKEFGSWVLFDLGNSSSPIITSKNIVGINVGSSASPIDLVRFANQPTQFIVENQSDQSTAIGTFPQVSEFEYPECITCSHYISPSINLMPPSILPDSILYPLFIYKEKKDSKQIAGKSAVYNYLGLSLKRIAEAQGLLQDGNPNEGIFTGTLDAYIALVKSASQAFQGLEDYQDKLNSAIDIHYYMDREAILITNLLSYDLDDTRAQKVNQAIGIIRSLDLAVRKYVPIRDFLTDRIYEIHTGISGNYSFFVDDEVIREISGIQGKITLSVDGFNKEANTSVLQSGWTSIGAYNLSSGTHIISLRLPEMPNAVGSFQPDNSTGSIPNASCYSSAVTDYMSTSSYKLNFEVPREQLNHLYFFIREQSGSKTVVIGLKKFTTLSGESSYATIFSANGSDHGWVVFCSDTLGERDIVSALNPQAQKILEPNLLIGQTIKEQESTKIAVSRQDPTKYTIVFNNSAPFFLTFLQSYDSQWSLEGYDSSHFISDGYANGWYIDKTGNQELTLVYKSQQVFNLGLIVTGLSVIALTAFVLQKRIKI